MPLRKKLLLSMIVPTMLLVTVGIIGISSLHHLKRAAGRILSHNYHSIEECRKMERSLRSLETIMLRTVSRRIVSLDTFVSRFERSLTRCENNVTEEGERRIMQAIRGTWEQLRPRFSAEQGKQYTIPRLQARNQITSVLYEQIDELVRLNERAMFSYEKQTRRAADMMLWSVSVALILAIVALVSFSLISARRIAGPIMQVSARLHEALNPHTLKQRATSPPRDEIASLREELDKLLDRLARHEDEQRKRLVHMQSRLAFVINEVLEGLVLIDDQHNIVAVNRVAGQILGLDEGQGRRLDQIRPREDIRAMLKPIMEGEFQPERDLGELKFMVGNAERIYRPRVLTVSGGSDNVEGYLLLFWDVTEQRRFEESRRKFISMLSHQLKTPMTSLSMSVNLLREKVEKMDPSHAELLSIASEDCNVLAGLISDLIEAAREPAPDLSLRLRHMDVVKLLQNGLRPLVPQAEEKGIFLSMPQAQPVKAWVDPVKFPWVITNIAGNALRYTNDGGKVVVSFKKSECEFTVDVSDNGPGIAQEDLANVFNAYVTLDTEPHHGTHGLGLAIAKEIVEAHRGTITVASQLGEGTTFRISVPFDSREAL